MIVVARGGGAIEDLLPFSDEAVVRAVFATHTPVVSAIGHEPDTPLLDLVADVRASTPTDAAKRVVPDVAEEAQRVLGARERGRLAIRHRLAERGAARRRAAQPPGARRPARHPGRAVRRGRGPAGTRPPVPDPAPRPGGGRPGPPARPGAQPLAVEHAAPGVRRGPGPDGAVVTDPAGLGTGTLLDIRLADGRISADDRTHPPPHRKDRPMPEKKMPAKTELEDKPAELGYEEAREQLVEVVRRLEQGGAGLEDSIALWERGEELATACQTWLDGARTRLEKAIAARDDAEQDEQDAAGRVVRSTDLSPGRASRPAAAWPACRRDPRRRASPARSSGSARNPWPTSRRSRSLRRPTWCRPVGALEARCAAAISPGDRRASSMAT